MDTDLLKTFMEVSRTRHFGRAAENLYLTQSAVSFRVRQLEDILGVELFSRQRNNIQLTPAGEKLMPLAESSVLLEQRIRSEVARADGQTHSLAIGATPNLSDAFLQYELTDLADGESLSLSATAHTGTTLIRQIGERSLKHERVSTEREPQVGAAHTRRTDTWLRFLGGGRGHGY